MARGIAIVAPIAAYMEGRRGQFVTIEELAKAFPDANRGSIQRVMLDLARRDVGLSVMSPGQVWCLGSGERGSAEGLRQAAAEAPVVVPMRPTVVKPSAPKVPEEEFGLGDLFEYMGRTTAGVFLRDKNGNLWTAKRA